MVRARPRAAMWVFVCAALVCSANAAFGQFTWNNFTNTGNTWTVGTNWVGSVAPPFDVNTVLTFPSTPNQFPPIAAYQPVGSYTVSIPAAATTHQLIFDNYASGEVNLAGVILQALTSSLTMAGASPSIVQNGTGSISLPNLTLTANGLNVGGSGMGHVSLGGQLVGTGPITINRPGATALYSGPQVNISGSNTFQGTVTLDAGNLVLLSTNVLGNSANQVVINGGSLRSPVLGFSTPRTFTLNTQLVLTGTSTFGFSGPMNGTGGVRFSPTSVATEALFTNTIAGTGEMFVSPLGRGYGTLRLWAAGSALNSDGYTIANGHFSIDNVGNPVITRINAAAVSGVRLYASQLSFLGNGITVASESVNSGLFVDGMAQLNLTPSTHAMTLNFGSLARTSNSATLFARSMGASSTMGNGVGALSNATLLFPAGTTAGNVNGVLPYALIQQGGEFGPRTLARYDAVNGMRPLNLATDYLSVKPAFFGTNATSQYRMIGFSYPIGGIDTARSVNSLLMETPGNATPGMGVFGTGTLSVTSGAIASVSANTVGQPPIVPAVISNPLAFGSATGYFHGEMNTALLGGLSGTGGFVKSMHGRLFLEGNNSGLSGEIAINAGIVSFTSDANLGAAGTSVRISGGVNATNVSGLVFQPTNFYGNASTPNATINRHLVFGMGGGTVETPLASTTLTVVGSTNGGGDFQKAGPGALILNGFSTHSGDTLLTAGTLVATPAQLGSGNVVMNGGTLMVPSGTHTLTSPIVILPGNTGAVYTDASTLTVAGVVSGVEPGTTFRKAGTGTLTLTAANTLSGPVTIGDASPTSFAGARFAQPGGVLQLSGNGALAVATSYTVHPGGRLELDNSAIAHNNRLASAPVTMNSGELVITGNNAANVVEHIGLGTNTNGLNHNTGINRVTLSQPASVGMNLSTTLVATAHGAQNFGLAFYRGNNLGNPAAGDHTIIRFATNPLLFSGQIISNSVYADATTANPQDFAAYNATNGVTRFTSYINLPATGATAGNIYSRSTNLTMSANQAVGALRMNNSTINTGGNTLTVGDSMTAFAGMLLSVGADAFTGGGSLNFQTRSAHFIVNNTLSVGTAGTPISITTSGIVKSGPGTLSLSGATANSGVYVSEGTLRTLTTTAINSTTGVIIAPQATLDLNNLGTIATPFALTSLNGFGTVNLGSGVVSIGNGASTFGGAFQGSGTIIKNGGLASLVLRGNSPSFTGGVRILNGQILFESNVMPADALNPGPIGTGVTPLQLGNTTGGTSVGLFFGALVTRFSRAIDVPAGSTGSVSFGSLTPTLVTMDAPITLNTRAMSIFNGSTGATSTPLGALTISGAISGTGPVGQPILRIENGSVNLWGNNNFTGNVEIPSTAGIVALGLGSDSALGNSSNQLLVNNTNLILRADNGARTIANGLTFPVSSNPILHFVGTNDITWNGPISVSNANLTANVSSTGTVSFNMTITSLAALEKAGGGLLIMNGPNTYSTGTFLSGGVLGFGIDSVGVAPIVSGPVGTNTLVIDGGTLRAIGGPRVVRNPIHANGDFAVDGVNNLTLGDIGLVSSGRRVVVTNTGTTTVLGGVTSGSINKDGPGLLVLTSGGSVVHPSTLTLGTLAVNNTTGNGLASVTVLDGRLRGTGSVNGGIVLNGGVFAPGDANNLGTFTISSQPVFNGGTFEASFASLASYSRLHVNDIGNLILGAGVTALNITLPYSGATDGAFTLISTSSGTSVSGMFAGLPDQSYMFTNPITSTPYYIYYGSSVVAPGGVVISPVPEPTTVLAVCAAACGLGTVIRRRLRKRRSSDSLSVRGRFVR